MPEFVQFENDGRFIRYTNYWEMEHARKGYAFLSLNAGAYRLLMPAPLHSLVTDITSSKVREVVISRGPWPSRNRPDGIEIMFDDHTDNPVAVHIETRQLDRLPGAADQGWKGRFLLYHLPTGGPAWQTDRVYYRQVKHIPWLKPAPEEA